MFRILQEAVFILFILILSISPEPSLTPACSNLLAALNRSTSDWRICRTRLSPAHEFPELKPTHVEINLLIVRVFGLDSKERTGVSGYVWLEWEDPRVSWNSSDTSSQDSSPIIVHKDDIWLPDVGFSTAIEDSYRDLRRLQTKDATIFPNGKVQYMLDFRVQYNCPQDARFFPFDKQLCQLEFAPISSTTETLKCKIQVEFPDTLADPDKVIGEWSIVRQFTDSKVYSDSTGNYSTVYLKLQFQRRSLYYWQVVLCPNLVLSLLASLLFFAEEQGDRIALGIAILMAMILNILITSEATPKSATTLSLLSIYLITQMILLLVFAVIASLNALSIDNKCKTETNMKSKIKSCLLRFRKHIDKVSLVFYFASTMCNFLLCLIIAPTFA